MDPQVSVKYNKIPTAIPIIPTTNPKNIGYDTKKIWTEYQLINRLLYRSRNQHKSSLSFQHLKEVKKLGERVGKLENWLKGNFVESGDKMFDFVGYLNTLRLLIEKTLESCRKSFYFYCQYLDQGLFLPLALVATGSVSSLHTELMQWNKYVRILYDCQMEKITKEFGMERIGGWRRENNLVEVLGPVKKESSELNVPAASATKIQQKDQIIPSKHKQNPPPPPPKQSSSSSQFKKKFVKKSKSNNGGDEIDNIFNLF